MTPVASAPMHFAFCVNNGYVPYITVTIKSIVENNRNNVICIHVLTDHLSDANRKRLAEGIDGYENATLHVYLVNDANLRSLKTGVWTIYTWYRVLLPEILPAGVKKVLYLDADTLVTADLQELFAMDMTDKSIAAPFDIQSLSQAAFDRCGYDRAKQYICAGVLLMNLDYWREHKIAAQLIGWANANHDRLFYPDQDAINYICQDTKILLPFKYNIFKFYLTGDLYKSPELFEDIRDCAYKPAIVHYAGYYPWIKAFATHPMQDVWEKYNRMLPHPVRNVYFPRKWLFVKMIVWKWLHRPFEKPVRLTLDDIKRRLSEYDS